jgi:ATPase subunit of ABC transporter with duplicated ATPase domains
MWKTPKPLLNGGEKGRMLFGKLMLQNPNVLVMDERTNHLDMESIEALNLALENYEGTLIFVSHDREFVSSDSLLRNFVAITVETKNPLKVAVNQQNMAIKKTY